MVQSLSFPALCGSVNLEKLTLLTAISIIHAYRRDGSFSDYVR